MSYPAMDPQHYPHLEFGQDVPDRNELADIQDPICKCDIGLPLHRQSAHIPLELAAPATVDVAVKGVVSSYLQCAQFAAYTTFTLNTGNEDPQQILPRDDKRLRAVIQVSTTTGVWLGKREQVFATVKQGWLQTSTMQPLELRNEQGLWMVGTGVPVNVMVVNERFA